MNASFWKTRKLVRVWLSIFLFGSLLLPTASVSAESPIPAIDHTSTAPLSAPGSAAQPRYISGFGLDNSYTIFYEDRNDESGCASGSYRIYFDQTTTGPLGFATAGTKTNICDSHFTVKDWPITIDTTPYSYRAWGAGGAYSGSHNFYVSNDLVNWTLVTTFTFDHLSDGILYGFHDIVQLNGHYIGWVESAGGNTYIASSVNGDDIWTVGAEVGGATAGAGPLSLYFYAGITGPKPSGNFVLMELDGLKTYAKMYLAGDYSGIYLAINRAAAQAATPALAETAFMNPANWTWRDGTTGLPTSASTVIANTIGTGGHDVREAWTMPRSDYYSDHGILYTANYASGAKGLGWGSSTPSTVWVGDTYNATGCTTAGHTWGADCFTKIEEGLAAVAAGGTVNVADGTYNVSATITVNKAVTITGGGGGGAIVQGTNASAVSIFEITVSNVTLQNLEITHNALPVFVSAGWLELPNSLIRIPTGTGLSGIAITSNKIYVPAQSGAMSTWNGVGITVGTGTTTDISITGNTVYNVRDGVVVQYSNIADISNNIIHDTKGGIMNYTNTQPDANNRTVSGNSWGTTHNEWDIVWNTAYYTPDYQASVLTLSGANNGAYVLDRRAGDPGWDSATNAAACAALTGNRSHIFVDDDGTVIAAHPARGNFNEPFKTIALGIEAVVPGGTVYIAAGTYPENVIVNKPVTLVGAGQANTFVQPTISNPVCTPGSMCGGAASNVFLVQANNVIIHDLTVDGDNPALTGGFDEGGANIDARNGIIKNTDATYNGLEVYNVTVKNIYLRGIYSTGGSFNFHNNIVTNVQGEANSIAMFAWYGPGIMANNIVSYANDAISANHSTGIQFLNNIVTLSGSGVHTDNSGDGSGGPGVADLIQGNNVDCTGWPDAYGIWVFVPYIAPTVNNNTVTNCAVGLSAWGQGAAVTTQFTNNTVKGDGTSHYGDTGAYITTDLISWGYTDVSVNFSGNVITGYKTGVYLTADLQTWNLDPFIAQTIDATFHLNQIFGNTKGADMGTAGTYIANFENNWWGAANGPGTVGPGNGDTVAAGFTYSPWCVNEACTGNPPPMPSNFYGSIHINDGAPSAGDKVDAYVTGVSGAAAHATITLDSVSGFLVYQIDVPGDVVGTSAKEGGVDNDLITFQIGTRVVATARWHSGTDVHLDFHPPEPVPCGLCSGNEGSAINFSGSANDWGGSVGSTYEWDWDNDSTYDATGQTPSHTWADNGTYTVGLKVTDSQGGVGTATVDVTVTNVAPTATFAATSPINEGNNSTLSFADPSDPSTVDTDATFHYSFACDGLDSSLAAIYAAAGTGTTTNCSFFDNGVYTVKGRIFDKDNGYTTYPASVTVNNVAPTVTLDTGNTYVWDESSTAERTFNYTATDPAGSNDPLVMTIDCGTGGQYVTGSDTGHSFMCIFADGPASPTISVSANDGDGGVTADSHAVTVNNVAPTATLGNDGPVNEGSPVIVSFSGQIDPSSADLASLHYAFDCNGGSLAGATYAGSGVSDSQSCTFTDNGSYTVSGKVMDKDGGSNEYTTSVTVNDVLPTNVDAHGPYNGIAGQSVALTGTATCAPVDTCTFAWDLDNDTLYDDAFIASPTHTWNTVGTYTIGLQVTDSDGNPVTDTAIVNIAGATHSIDLVPGWNLVSFKLQPTNTAIATVLTSITGKYDLVYAWDATGVHSGSGNWQKYDNIPLSPDTLDTLSEKMGFWIHVTSPLPTTTLAIVGSVPTTPATDINLSIAAGGWNLVGYPSNVIRPLPAALGGTGFSLVFAYHASETANPWKLYDPIAPPYASDLTDLSAGWGYWVKVSVIDTWNVPY